MFKDKNKNLGFTLIELLVVIAIIGTLSSIAVINIQSSVKKSQNKSMQGLASSVMQLAVVCYESGTYLCSDCIEHPDFGDPAIKLIEPGKIICENEVWPEPIKNWAWDFYLENKLGVVWQYKAERTDGSGDVIYCENWKGKTACRLLEN